jgi:hypothetical protein
MKQKKHILKPGRHQFAPGEHAAHDNENLTDEAAAWYLKKYPHIRSLFSDSPNQINEENLNDKPLRVKRKRIGVIALKSEKP